MVRDVYNSFPELLDALDEAIAKVTWAEYTRLKKLYPKDYIDSLQDAFESLDKLRGYDKPRYDKWDAPLYLSWYQARQVHLVYTVLQQYPPPQSGRPLQVIDIGCGALAVAIALAVLVAESQEVLQNRKVLIYGIDPSKSMTELGKKLWLEFGCAAEYRGLNVDFFEMIDEDRIFMSLDAFSDALSRDAADEFWLFSVHAVYEKSIQEIESFRNDFQERHANRLQYQLITSAGNKKNLMNNGLVSGLSRVSNTSSLSPFGKRVLDETTKCRHKIREELMNSAKPLSDRCLNYLKPKVAWDLPKNPIENDEVWVKQAS